MGKRKRGDRTETITCKKVFYGSNVSKPCPNCGTAVEVDPDECEIFRTIGWSKEHNCLIEAFLTKGKSGECRRLLLDVIARLVSNMLQDEKPIIEITKLLRGTICDRRNAPLASAHTSCIDEFGHAVLEASGFKSVDDYLLYLKFKADEIERSPLKL